MCLHTTSRRLLFVTFVLCLSSVLQVASNAEEVLKIHEWGTFTSLQNEAGQSLGRINTDDEPVPSFVHQFARVGQFLPTNIPPRDSKAVDWAMPQVTMRLETPVTYFHLPVSQSEMTLDLSVGFRGGWLTQYYPAAIAKIGDKDAETVYKFVELGPDTLGSLSWQNVKLGTTGEGPQTQDRIWLAPRNVEAANVTVGNETERFLFYRGVGNLNAPLRVVREGTESSSSLQIFNQFSNSLLIEKRPKISHAWLLEVMPDGQSAFRVVPEFEVTEKIDSPLTSVSATFAQKEFSKENLARLRAMMHAALERNGLFGDEAEALLATWELSYFRSPGQRLFFLVPQSWTDHYLPLKASVPAEVTRVMVGRIELETPQQRKLLQQIAEIPVSSLKDVLTAVKKLEASAAPADRETYNALASGRGDLSILGVEVAANYRCFIELGRFRSALLLDAAYNGSVPFFKTLPQPNSLHYFLSEVEKPGQGAAQWQKQKVHLEQALLRQRGLQ